MDSAIEVPADRPMRISAPDPVRHPFTVADLTSLSLRRPIRVASTIAWLSTHPGLEVDGVAEPLRVLALQTSGPERLQMAVALGTDPAQPGLGDPRLRKA